jgi:hypothetical protein
MTVPKNIGHMLSARIRNEFRRGTPEAETLDLVRAMYARQNDADALKAAGKDLNVPPGRPNSKNLPSDGSSDN